MIDVEEILSKMNPNQKINYDRVMQKMVQVWEKNEERPTILMHVCCAPCSTYTLEYLTKYADVTIDETGKTLGACVDELRKIMEQRMEDGKQARP